MSQSSAFWSGGYRTWQRSREIQVPKKCGGALVRGLHQAIIDPQMDKIEVILNNNVFTDYYHEKDRLLFMKELPRGRYRLEIKITYKDLEKIQYERY